MSNGSLARNERRRINDVSPNSKVQRLDCAFAFFFTAQRASINADNFFLAAAIITKWTVTPEGGGTR